MNINDKVVTLQDKVEKLESKMEIAPIFANKIGGATEFFWLNIVWAVVILVGVFIVKNKQDLTNIIWIFSEFFWLNLLWATVVLLGIGMVTANI